MEAELNSGHRAPRVLAITAYVGPGPTFHRPAPPSAPSLGIRAFAFTTAKTEAATGFCAIMAALGWEPHIFEPPKFPGEHPEDVWNLSGKVPKICPVKMPAVEAFDPDYVIWVDNKYNLNPRSMVAAIEDWERGAYPGTVARMYTHPRGPTHQHFSLWGEFNASMRQSRYERVKSRMYAYITSNAPRALFSERETPLVATGVIVWNMRNPYTQSFQAHWWDAILECGIQCQISLAVLRLQLPLETVASLEGRQCVGPPTSMNAFLKHAPVAGHPSPPSATKGSASGSRRAASVLLKMVKRRRGKKNGG